MTDKRFTYTEQFNGFCDVYDDGRVLSCMRLEYVEKTLNLLNGLNEENNELKHMINDFKHEIHRLKQENKELKKELQEFKNYVFSDENILCYSCVNCVSKGIYEVECSEKGKVDVHGTCFLYWKNEVEK